MLVPIMFKLTRKTYCDAIIPERNIILAPLKPDMEFLGGGDDFIEIVDNHITLNLRHPHNLRHEPRVEK